MKQLGETRYVTVRELPCDICQTDLEPPHVHAIRPDGSVGSLVLTEDQARDLGVWEDDE